MELPLADHLNKCRFKALPKWLHFEQVWFSHRYLWAFLQSNLFGLSEEHSCPIWTHNLSCCQATVLTTEQQQHLLIIQHKCKYNQTEAHCTSLKTKKWVYDHDTLISKCKSFLVKSNHNLRLFVEYWIIEIISDHSLTQRNMHSIWGFQIYSDHNINKIESTVQLRKHEKHDVIQSVLPSFIVFLLSL